MNRPPHDPQALLETYANHPLREETILARIARQRGTLDGITELDLAHDSLTEITDQNHVGGIAATVTLALLAGVAHSSRVLDIGSGLGGPARCLAHLFGCRAEGVEFSPLRCAQARSLTSRVGLDDLVTFTCGDILSVDLPSAVFDVILGQGAWTHIEDTSALFQCAAAALAPGGRVAFEEPCLLRPARSAEIPVLEELEQIWGGRFLSRGDWQSALASASLETGLVDDLTGAFLSDFRRLDAIARRQPAGQYPANEMQAFADAITLARAGVIGYLRFVARSSGPIPKATRSGSESE